MNGCIRCGSSGFHREACALHRPILPWTRPRWHTVCPVLKPQPPPSEGDSAGAALWKRSCRIPYNPASARSGEGVSHADTSTQVCCAPAWPLALRVQFRLTSIGPRRRHRHGSLGDGGIWLRTATTPLNPERREETYKSLHPHFRPSGTGPITKGSGGDSRTIAACSSAGTIPTWAARNSTRGT